MKGFLPPGKTCNSKTSGKEGLRILCEVGSIDFLDHLGIIVGWGSDHKLIQIIPNFLLFRKLDGHGWRLNVQSLPLMQLGGGNAAIAYVILELDLTIE